MSAYRALLLDFDGTLVDSAPGIVGCLQHALAAVGADPLPEPTLRSVIGLPLNAGFRQFGLDQATAETASAAYRAHWKVWGLDKWTFYPDVVETLTSLRERGVTLVLASAKHATGIQAAVDRVGLSALLDGVCGSQPDDTDKRGVLERALAQVPAERRHATAMVGDHRPDADAAAHHRLPFICADYGYGDPAVMAEQTAAAHIDGIARLLDLTI